MSIKKSTLIPCHFHFQLHVVLEKFCTSEIMYNTNCLTQVMQDGIITPITDCYEAKASDCIIASLFRLSVRKTGVDREATGCPC